MVLYINDIALVIISWGEQWGPKAEEIQPVQIELWKGPEVPEVAKGKKVEEKEAEEKPGNLLLATR